MRNSNIKYLIISNLKRNRVKVKKQAEFFSFFTEEKEKIIALQYKIKDLDNEINAKIYKLYNLNELEIKQIEDEYEKK